MTLKPCLALLVSISLLANLSACGLILYPERKGQLSGRIDPGIAVLDGLGLLLFIVPGVIAFAVDFSMGTIYLPGGRRAALDVPPGPLNPQSLDAAHATAVEAALKQELGLDLSLDAVPPIRLNTLEALEAKTKLLASAS